MGQHDAVVEKHWIPVHSGLVSLRCQWLNKGSFQGLFSLKGKLTANGFVICITRGIQSNSCDYNNFFAVAIMLLCPAFADIFYTSEAWGEEIPEILPTNTRIGDIPSNSSG